MSRKSLSLATIAVFLYGIPTAAPARADGDVEGRVELALPGVSLADVGPVVVYLENDAELRGRATASPRGVAQKGARFSPELITVGVGQAVKFFNDDSILHNVFSYSKPKPFDLGLARAGSVRTVTFDRPGPVQVYCSIHAMMNATVFVAPSPFHAKVEAAGRFALRGVPAGLRRVGVWCQKLPETKPIAVQVVDGQVATVVVRLGGE